MRCRAASTSLGEGVTRTTALCPVRSALRTLASTLVLTARLLLERQVRATSWILLPFSRWSWRWRWGELVAVR